MSGPDVVIYGKIAPGAKTLLALCMAVFVSFGIAEGTERPGSESLIQREMQALDSALKATVDAMVLNEPGRVVPAFREVNQLREEVEQAVRGGAVLTLPRNQKRFREFVRLDSKFHRDLEILLTAAKKNNMGVVQRQTHRLLDGCVRCHRIFRK